MLNLPRLRLLRELHRRGTLAAVAEALALTPSAVSQQLRQLERETGCTLLERVGRGVTLTDTALLLVSHAEAIIERLERAEADLAATTGVVTGVIRVATFQTAGIALIPPTVSLLATWHPQLRVEIREQGPESSIAELLAGTIDLVVEQHYDHFPQPPEEGVERAELFHDRMRLALPAQHPLGTSGRPVTLADLADHTWAGGHDKTGFGEVLPRACSSLAGFVPDIAYRSNDFAVLVALVAAGHAVALLPELGASEEPPGVVLRDVAEGELGRQIYTSIRKGAASHPAINATRSALRSARDAAPRRR